MIYLTKNELLSILGVELVDRIDSLKLTEFYCLKQAGPTTTIMKQVGNYTCQIVSCDTVAGVCGSSRQIEWYPIKYLDLGIQISDELSCLICEFARVIQIRKGIGCYLISGLNEIESRWLKDSIAARAVPAPTLVGRLKARIKRWLD